MTITGEQIKDARERRRMTQQELADELGVSLRTVGSWERGESVPRSRMGAIREVLKMEGPNDGREELSRLIQEELDTSRRGPAAIVRGWDVGPTRSFYDWRDGSAIPRRASRPLLEDALGWRRGVVTEILEAPITKTFTLSEVRDWSTTKPGIEEAAELTDPQLTTELIARLDGLRKEVARLKAENEALRGNGNVIQLHGDKPHYDLAASDEHVPGEDDND